MPEEITDRELRKLSFQRKNAARKQYFASRSRSHQEARHIRRNLNGAFGTNRELFDAARQGTAIGD